MYLYSLIQTNFDTNDDISVVRDLYLLQHEKSFTNDEFHDLVTRYKSSAETNWHVAHLLEKNHGFRIVPAINL
ncbi:hypothetical protein [Bacillus sp. AFS055030]|uniref:hypothetical protein n=1 Tax=Bacillus sp. AFS055030 TaxID=2033507 RepID=UPI000BFBBB7B|nr:hypothetical protein [Bacillus sp. AFS055030]PGL71915.1 hypothetical protein CN925_05050 [Bacillus sp. AFS055030]